jgi:hypothetical protein
LVGDNLLKNCAERGFQVGVFRYPSELCKMHIQVCFGGAPFAKELRVKMGRRVCDVDSYVSTLTNEFGEGLPEEGR